MLRITSKAWSAVSGILEVSMSSLSILIEGALPAVINKSEAFFWAIMVNNALKFISIP
jgi:hypothetical protein